MRDVRGMPHAGFLFPYKSAYGHQALVFHLPECGSKELRPSTNLAGVFFVCIWNIVQLPRIGGVCRRWLDGTNRVPLAA